MNSWPLSGDVLVLDQVSLIITTKNAAFAGVNIHGFHKLIFAIHALKLNVSIAGRIRMVVFVLLTFLQNDPRFFVFFLYLRLDLPNS